MSTREITRRRRRPAPFEVEAFDGEIVARRVRFPAPPPPALVLAPPRRRRQRPWRVLSLLCIVAGLALAGDVAATLLWQEPVTAVISVVRRADLNQRWAKGVPLDRVDQSTLASIHGMDARLAFLANRENRTAPDGAALGTVTIKAIGVHYQMVQGTTESSLALGPGHYDSTALPGEGRTVAIAGHRTTYLAPFRNINELEPGDQIHIRMPYGRFVYTVQKLQVVSPNAWWITKQVGYERLVLSSCNPLFSAAQRLAVFARLASVTPARMASRG